MYHLCKKYVLEKTDTVKVLHMAPERAIYKFLKGHPLVNYTCIDLYPEAYAYAKGCLREDALAMSFANETFDVIISSHVLEHVPDAKAFIRESIRCLKKTGVILLNFPLSLGRKSFEDSSIVDSRGRSEAFGHWDHVRLFGDDFLEYLQDESYTMISVKEDQLVSQETIRQSVLTTGSSDAYIIVTPNMTPSKHA